MKPVSNSALIDPSRRDAASQLAALTLGLGTAGLLADDAKAQTGNTLVVGMASHPPHLNSAISSGVATGIPGAQLFASPLRFDNDWTPQP
ncbi:MAG: hypothetical protein ACK5SV_05805, partial [Burkholderiales bacterium]